MQFTNTALEAMKNRCIYIEANRRQLVIDADTHLSDLDNP